MNVSKDEALFSRSVKRLASLGPLLIVPLYMMWDVLFVNSDGHLANPGRLPVVSTVTDLDGAARLAYILSGMAFPWSDSSFVSSPQGAGIWRIETVTQAIQVVLLWSMSRVFTPMISCNLLVLIGWFVTGIAVYRLSRTLGGGIVASLCAAWCVQLLPNIRFMAANFTSYVFIGLPIVVLILTIKFRQDPSRRNLLTLGCGALTVIFFDPYFALFSLWIMILVLSPVLVRLIRNGRPRITSPNSISTVLVWFTCAGLLILISVLPQFLGGGASDRAISVASRFDARNSSLGFESWFHSPFTGVGTVLPLLFFISGVSFLKRSGVECRAPAVICGLYILVSTRFSIPGTDVVLAPAEFFRFVLPGVRFFDRASLVAIPIAVVIGFVQAETWAKHSSSARRTIALQILLFSLSVTSFPNLARPGTTQSYNDWGEIRRELAKVDNPRVLALPLSRRGRDWIEQASFQAPLMNDYVESVFDHEIMMQASHGPGTLVAFLRQHRVTHLLLVPGELSDVLTYGFDEPRFSRVTSIRLNGFGEGPDFEVGLYTYVTLTSDVPCQECGPGPYLIPSFSVLGDLVYPPDVLADGTRWWWSGAGDIELQSNITEISPNRGGTGVKVKLSLAPCAARARISIYAAGFLRIIELTSQMQEATVRLQHSEDGRLSAKLQIFGEPCIPSGDSRSMLVQVQPSLIASDAP